MTRYHQGRRNSRLSELVNEIEDDYFDRFMAGENIVPDQYGNVNLTQILAAPEEDIDRFIAHAEWSAPAGKDGGRSRWSGLTRLGYAPRQTWLNEEEENRARVSEILEKHKLQVGDPAGFGYTFTIYGEAEGRKGNPIPAVAREHIKQRIWDARPQGKVEELHDFAESLLALPREGGTNQVRSERWSKPERSRFRETAVDRFKIKISREKAEALKKDYEAHVLDGVLAEYGLHWNEKDKYRATKSPSSLTGTETRWA